MKWLRLPDKVLKCVNHLWWLISPSSVWSCPVVFAACFGSLATDTARMQRTRRLGNRHVILLAAGWRKSFQSEESRLSGSESLLLKGRFFFRVCIAPLPVRGFWEFLHFLNSFLFYFSYSLSQVKRAYAPWCITNSSNRIERFIMKEKRDHWKIKGLNFYSFIFYKILLTHNLWIRVRFREDGVLCENPFKITSDVIAWRSHPAGD